MPLPFKRCDLGHGDQRRVVQLLGQLGQPVQQGKAPEVGKDLQDPFVTHGSLALNG
jgi:hypothetical protein